ncbi:1748_t:CDS:10, partial [Gigaspora margarita]
MSFNKDKFTTVEDVTSSPTNSDIEPSPKTGQTNFENFGRLSMDLLRFFDFVGSDNLGKGKGCESEKNSKEASDDSNKFNFEAFSDGFGNVPFDEGRSKAKSSNDFMPPRMPSAANEMPTDWGFQEGLWKKRDLSKARNQWEYNEWCRIGLLLDKALLSGEVEYVHLAKQLVLERAYVVRVADEDGWGVAVKMAASDIMDPMSELFGAKRERARTAAQQFYRSKRPRASYEQNHTFNGRQWQPQTQVPNMYVPTFVPSTLLESKLEQWRESSPQESSGSCFLNQQAPQYNSWKNTYRQHQEFQYPQTSMYRNFGSSSRSGAPRELVCYLCEEKVQNLEKVNYTQGFSSQNKEETLGEKEELVMGRLHSKAAICYWRNVIKPAPIVMEWLERKVPLFPRGVMNLAALPVPKPWSFTIEEREWINLEHFVKPKGKGDKSGFEGLYLKGLGSSTRRESQFNNIRELLKSSKNEWDKEIVLSEQALEDMQWLIENLEKWNGHPARKPSKVKMVFVDASVVSWCGVYQGLVAAENWRINSNFNNQQQSGFENSSKWGLEKWQKDIAQEIWNLYPEDWVLKMDIVKQLENRWEKFDIDQFASHLNTKMRRFNSLHFCSGSEAGMQSTHSNYCTSLGCSSMVAHDYGGSKRGNGPSTTKGNNSTLPLRVSGTLQQQQMEVESNSNRLVHECLKYAKYLMQNFVNEVYRKRLGKAWKRFVEFSIK